MVSSRRYRGRLPSSTASKQTEEMTGFQRKTGIIRRRNVPKALQNGEGGKYRDTGVKSFHRQNLLTRCNNVKHYFKYGPL